MIVTDDALLKEVTELEQQVTVLLADAPAERRAALGRIAERVQAIKRKLSKP